MEIRKIRRVVSSTYVTEWDDNGEVINSYIIRPITKPKKFIQFKIFGFIWEYEYHFKLRRLNKWAL